MRLGDGIQRARRLVQDDDGRVLQKDPRDGDALFLAAGKHHAPLAHVGLVTLGHGADILVDLRVLRGRHHLRVRRVRTAVADVFHDRIGEQEHVLLHDADLVSQGFLGQRAHVAAIHGHGAAGDVVEAGDQLAQRRLAAAGSAHEGDLLTRQDLQIHMLEHERPMTLRLAVLERNVLEFDMPFRVL